MQKERKGREKKKKKRKGKEKGRKERGKRKEGRREGKKKGRKENRGRMIWKYKQSKTKTKAYLKYTRNTIFVHHAKAERCGYVPVNV
jgi:hypothetical protein